MRHSRAHSSEDTTTLPDKPDDSTIHALNYHGIDDPPNEASTEVANALVSLQHVANLGQEDAPTSSFVDSIMATAAPQNIASTFSQVVYQMHDSTPQQGSFENVLQTPSSMGNWGMDIDFYHPSWFAGPDFDIEALNSSIAASISQYGQPAEPVRDFDSTIKMRVDSGTIPYDQSSPQILNDVGRLWYTRMGKNSDQAYSALPTGMNSPTHMPDQVQIDEPYRLGLSRKLKQRIYDDSLPSTSFLNLCTKMYFTRFNPVFPIIHAPTFRPMPENSLLLFSICSIGSLFIGSASAVAQGTKIFETLNKSILASWEQLLGRSRTEAMAMTRASLIGQTWALTSGNPRHLVLAESFHGTVLALARQVGMFRVNRPKLSKQKLRSSGEDLDILWREWKISEEMHRAAGALHIHDAELANIFHHEPLLRHGRTFQAASDRAFGATTPKEWAKIMLDQNSARQPSRFASYITLEGISANIRERKVQGPMDEACLATFRDDLMVWYNDFRLAFPEQQSDPLGCMVLWHAVFLSLYADFDVVENAIGKESVERARLSQKEAAKWASSPAGKRCMIHASLIQGHMEDMSLGTEPGIHVPRSLFHAAIAWYCCVQFGDDASFSSSSSSGLDFPEIRLLGINPAQRLFEICGFKFAKPTVAHSSTLCGLTDFLQRIGHWEISRRFATILNVLLQGENDGSAANGQNDMDGTGAS